MAKLAEDYEWVEEESFRLVQERFDIEVRNRRIKELYDLALGG